jgi:hypothetical protein
MLSALVPCVKCWGTTRTSRTLFPLLFSLPSFLPVLVLGQVLYGSLEQNNVVMEEVQTHIAVEAQEVSGIASSMIVVLVEGSGRELTAESTTSMLILEKLVVVFGIYLEFSGSSGTSGDLPFVLDLDLAEGTEMLSRAVCSGRKLIHRSTLLTLAAFSSFHATILSRGETACQITRRKMPCRYPVERSREGKKVPGWLLTFGPRVDMIL